jgi:hypothetical protein
MFISAEGQSPAADCARTVETKPPFAVTPSPRRHDAASTTKMRFGAVIEWLPPEPVLWSSIGRDCIPRRCTNSGTCAFGSQ